MTICAAATALAASAASNTTSATENGYTFPTITVDKQGRMRNSATNEEVRYFGTNYTLPFAHAYRAMNTLGIDRKEAIDRDVYHLSRMGVNAFRLHLWDVELSDSVGNLIENDHLDLLDYLLASLQQRGITAILTAQTNFGNGYPERNTDTGAYSYDYDKCDIHANPAAIKAQQRYIKALVEHVNPYTSMSYAADPAIIAIEINNEPCHTSSPKQVESYINGMVKAVRNGGWRKPVLYNVSHNMDMVPGYFAADIQGTTYQWYPVGLVAGRERKGNFIPYVDNYAIPFSSVKGFGNKAKVVYEFDPADMLQSYMFPAVARTFAREGFQWATQFAYDPIDMARFNTEYQTHFLNLAYTPQKALGMKIATRVMQNVPDGADYGKYPADTVFGPATVSYRRNLAVWNTPEEFFHTNNVAEKPVAPDSLKHVAGYGSSAVVEYDGRGAYLLDLIQPGLWRLEVMPDVLYSADPFAKPSLKREVAHIFNTSHPMALTLPGLSDNFHYRSITETNPFGGTADGNTIHVTPGVYLLATDSTLISNTSPSAQWGAIQLDEYVAPQPSALAMHLNHKPTAFHPAGSDLTVRAEAFGTALPDSLVIYPTDASFWREHNRLYTMKRTAPYLYEAVIPASDMRGKTTFAYRIAAVAPDTIMTFPGVVAGAPLDWDAPESAYYTTALLPEGAPLPLLNCSTPVDWAEVSTIPDQWGRTSVTAENRAPMAQDVWKLSVKPGSDTINTVITTYIGDIISPLGRSLQPSGVVIKSGKTDMGEITVALVNRDGITYSARATLTPDSETVISLGEFGISPTILCPAPFPVFLEREFMPNGYSSPLDIADIEKLQLVFPAPASESHKSAEIVGVWLR